MPLQHAHAVECALLFSIFLPGVPAAGQRRYTLHGGSSEEAGRTTKCPGQSQGPGFCIGLWGPLSLPGDRPLLGERRYCHAVRSPFPTDGKGPTVPVILASLQKLGLAKKCLHRQKGTDATTLSCARPDGIFGSLISCTTSDGIFGSFTSCTVPDGILGNRTLGEAFSPKPFGMPIVLLCVHPKRSSVALHSVKVKVCRMPMLGCLAFIQYRVFWDPDVVPSYICSIQCFEIHRCCAVLHSFNVKASWDDDVVLSHIH